MESGWKKSLIVEKASYDRDWGTPKLGVNFENLERIHNSKFVDSLSQMKGNPIPEGPGKNFKQYVTITYSF